MKRFLSIILVFALFSCESEKIDARFGKIDDVFFRKDYENAIPKLEELLLEYEEKDYNYFLGLKKLGEAYFNLEKFDKATIYFDKMLGGTYEKSNNKLKNILGFNDIYLYHKFEACSFLGYIAIQKEDTVSLKAYIDKMENEYNYPVSCGLGILEQAGKVDFLKKHCDWYKKGN